MSSINILITNISTQNISLFFENKITSFKPEKDVFVNTVNEEAPYSDPVKIGHAELKNHEELLVFTCKYNKELTARSAKKQQFEIAKKILKEDFKDGAIFIFYDEQGNFRFSFIRRNYGQTGDNKYSTWKRYTYYVTPSETNRTFKERIDNCVFDSLDNIQEAFSVEKLTKQFYNELFAWYQWALSDEIGITYPNNTNTSDDDRVKLEEQVIRLITRLLFVWFIKQKKLVPEYLFINDELTKTLKDFDSNSKEEGNYYNAILQNLFFATLNKEISEREFAKTKNRDIKTRLRYEEMFNLSEAEIIELFKPIPFLNGGLFECLDKQDADGNQYFLDGFSRNPTTSANGNFRHRAFIPNCLFFDEEKGIIPLLKRYNFTVEENAPNEVQVALDPELLGKVFENLLGAFNPETKETARKQSGSFYTPREIVDYMVDESLINYLQTKLTTVEETTLRELFEKEELPEALINNSSLRNEVAEQLKAIKILDPACGSGAFPMGILNKLVELFEKIDANSESIHDLKLHLIEDCIYGIDIQPIAIQISKLRFFISLVVEQKAIDITKPEDNYGVLTLPNLETKFVAANTLIGIKAKPKQHNLFEDPLIDETKEDLLATRHEHFYAKTAGAKKRLREQDAELRDKLSALLRQNKEFAPEDALQLSQWNPYDQNRSSPFFDMEWMFGLKKGFDVVIGNPPWGAKLSKEEKALYKTIYTEIDSSTPNSFAYFCGIGLKLTENVLTYVLPDSILIKDFKKTRKLLKDNLIEISWYLNTGIPDNHKPFVYVEHDVCLLMINKLKNQSNCKVIKQLYNTEDKSVFRDEYMINKNEFILEQYNYNYNLIIKDKELKLLDRFSGLSTLKSKVQIHEGIHTGNSRKILFHDSKINDFCKPLYYGGRAGDRIENFVSNMQGWFVDYRKEIIDKDLGYYASLRNEKIFIEPKLYITRTGNPIKVFYDKNNYASNNFFSLQLKNYEENLEENLKLLLPLILSNFSNYFIRTYCSPRLGATYVETKIAHLLKIPLPNDLFENENIKVKFNSIVNKIIALIKEGLDYKIEMDEIDLNIYKLYNLTYSEVLTIDQQFTLTQTDYDNYNT